MPVEKADADERETESARRLQVVAGEHAEATGVLGQRFGDAELGREVRDGTQRALAAVLEPAGAFDVAAQFLVELGEERHEGGVLRERVESFARNEAEQSHRIVASALPGGRIDPSEQVAGPFVP